MSNRGNVNKLPKPNADDLATALGKVAYLLDKAYVLRLTQDYKVLPFKQYKEYVNRQKGTIDPNTNIRGLKIIRWVYNSDEQIRDCFKNVLGIFNGGNHNIALLIKRLPTSTEMYFFVKNEEFPGSSPANQNLQLLKDSLCGNFSGTEIEPLESKNHKVFLDFEDAKAISVVSGIPSDKSEDSISQGIEKILNGIVPQQKEDSYSILILAQPIDQAGIRTLLSEYETLASSLSGYAGKQLQSSSATTNTEGKQEQTGHTIGKAIAENKTKQVNANINVNASVTATVGASLGASFFVNAGATASVGTTVGAGISGGFGYSWGSSVTESINDTVTVGTNSSLSLSESESETITTKSYLVSDLITKLEALIKRINECQSMGMFSTAAYIISENQNMSKNVANFWLSLMKGDQSFLEASVNQTWYSFGNGQENFNNIREYLTHITHPIFQLKNDPCVSVMAASNLSTNELSNLFSFPRFSVQGLPIVECARFGREPHSLGKLSSDVRIGSPYYMHHKEEGKISLSLNELTKHTFITGTTGSGKSNTVYKLLSEVCFSPKSKVKFMVIEPAKGEYKDVFGGYPDVTVYGTNPYKFPNLLQINPFYFPDDIHVLEHVDRLVEVFNACWPMYAAMPAILKESVERAYENCGWNLRTSKNPGRYPTFNDLLKVLPEVIESSNYSSDTSSDYKGALITRVRSLTRGIHGQIFSGNTNDDTLFNTNVIVDISRVGSSETKSLLMGILILRLQEFRMHEDKHNSELRHLTVVEEAHHLLRKTSNTQTQESSNLQGKSVEMIGNAIAEMRTYGEGFIIADQSPELMDMSVIRNTNTKIIMRLPEESDRIIVGKAAGLTDSQIIEVSKFACGVAAVLQSEWLEPVLCMVDEFTAKKAMSQKYKSSVFQWEDSELMAKRKFIELAMGAKNHSLSSEEVDCIRKWYKELGISQSALRVFELVLQRQKIEAKEKMLLVSYCVGGNIREIVAKNDLIEEINRLLFSKFDFAEKSDVVRITDSLFNEYFPNNHAIEPFIKNGNVK